MTAFYEQITDYESDFPITFEIQHLNNLKKKIAIHWHESIEFIYIVEGSVEVILGNEKKVAYPGDSIIINSNVLHSFFSISEKCKYNYLKIDTSFFRSFNLDIELLEFYPILRNDYIDKFFKSLEEEYINGHDYFKIKIKADVLNLTVYLLRNNLKSEKTLNNTDYNEHVVITKQILSYINKSYQYNISLEEISKEVGVSKYHLCRIFKSITSHTIVEHINTVRCENAKILLSTSKYTISQVAEMCGFTSSSYFAKTYKKIFGTSPSSI